jgi:hypothetical protein
MAENPKYIIFDNGLSDIPILFPHFIEHSTIAAMFPTWKAESAAFVNLYAEDGPQPYGNSTSLNLTVGESDAKLIAKMLNVPK